MPGIDDPFDDEGQSGNNIRLFRRERLRTEPLNTVTTRLGGGVPHTQLGMAGLAQITYSNPSTGFRSSRETLAKSKDSGLNQLILDQDYGDHFFTKSVALTEPPDKVDWDLSWAGFPQSMHGYRWPCEDSREKSLMDYSTELDYVDTATLSELFYWGGEGIARTLPTVPEASVVTALGELARDLPKIPGSSRLSFANGRRGIDVDTSKPTLGEASNEFLNYTFGIQPTVRDTQDIYSASTNADRILDQYRRDANRKVRRRVLLLDESSTTHGVHMTPQVPLGYPYIDPLGNAVTPCIHEVTTRKKVWFSGSYQYSLPSVDKRLQKLGEFNRLYGVIPTPEDLWNLTAWSWLTDWYANTGTVLKNLSTLSRDGIRIHYAYVMMEISKEYSYSNSGNTVKFVESNKNRVKASPFGYGIRPGSLSNKQRAILTALGISRWS